MLQYYYRKGRTAGHGSRPSQMASKASRAEHMNIACIGDLLERADEFERQIGKFYAAIHDETENADIRLLTCYLARHADHLKQALGDFSLGEIGPICEERLVCATEFPDAPQRQIIETDPAKVRGRELLECAMKHDGALIGLYRSVLDQHPSDGAANLFENLVRMEESDIVMLKRMIDIGYF
jgi:rubrerythrin